MPRDESHLAKPAFANQLMKVLAQWIEPNVEVHRMDEAAGLRELEQPGGFGRGHGQRLFAHDMLARRQRGLCMRVMDVVGRRDVYDIDALIGQHRLHRFICGWQSGRSRSLGGPNAAGADDAVDLDSEPAKSVNVNGADESRADHRGAQVASNSCSHVSSIA